MGFTIDENRAIFLQIAERITDDIIEGRLLEEAQVPSTLQFAAFYKINPATAAKGVNMLVDLGILYKKRGIGMFVAEGARMKLMVDRKEQFYEQYVMTMIQESRKLRITAEELAEMIRRGESSV